VLKHTIEELGEIYLTSSTHLFENFARAGIAHWWENKPDAPKGGAIFTYYDAEKTCLRLMPNAPKFFQTSVRHNLISHATAHDLGHELLTTLGVLLEGYTGFFASEIRSGPIGRGIRHASDPNARSILAAHQHHGPDELYAAMPWPLMPEHHFRLGNFSPAGRDDYIEEACQIPLRAMSIGIDLVTCGAGAHMPVENLTSRLEWMKGRRRSRLALNDESDTELRKIVLPCFTGGFQGVTFGLFRHLPADLEQFAISQLQQFSACIGEQVAKRRELDVATVLAHASNLTEYAEALMKLLPPVEHAVFAARGEKAGFKLNREANYLAGYRALRREELAAACADPDNELLFTAEDDRQPRIYVKFPNDPEALSPVFTLLRLRARMSELPSLTVTRDVQQLSRTELGLFRHALRRQIDEGRGALAASKKLFLVEAVLQDFDLGETTLTNSKARQYMERSLGKPHLGYQVAGKAARKFEEDIKKMVPQRFLFEAHSAHSVRVRWRPAAEHSASSGKAAQLRG
jgi:hypothetical protein